MRLIVTAAARLGSHADGAFAAGLAGINISPSHVHDLAREIGSEMAAQRDAKAKRPRRQIPVRVGVTPEAVAVEVDGGRLYTRAPDNGQGVHDAQNKEDKIACLINLKTEAHEQDPQPEPPESFLQPRRVQRLVQQMQGLSGDKPEEEAIQEDAPAEPPPEAEPKGEEKGEKPARVRTCVASMTDSHTFGKLMAAEAQERGFYQAKRRAFLGDGAAYNWAIQKAHFADFEPINDFLHLLCYIYMAAWAVGSSESERWTIYTRWLRSCWQGRVAEVLEELVVWQGRVGKPPPGVELEKKDPRRLVAEALSYLGNNRDRMDYPRYRKDGLPITSSLAESLVGEFNARVKSKQKYWDRPEGAEAILQLRAALLSEDERLERYFRARPGCPFRRRPKVV